jgi:hypothetical protein
MDSTENSSLEERRSESRKFLTYFSRVIDRDTGIMLGYLVDLTTGGALLIGNVSLKPDSVLHLRLDLPEDFFPKEQLDIEARAVWSRPDSDPEFYRTGLQLFNVKPTDLNTLERLLSIHSSIL